jgi:hypothetical protein
VTGLLGTGARGFHPQGETVWRLYHDRRRFLAAVSTIAAVALAVLAALEFLTSLERKDSTMSLGLILVVLLLLGRI